jgi:hypothetical protein
MIGDEIGWLRVNDNLVGKLSSSPPSTLGVICGAEFQARTKTTGTLS